MGLFLVRSVERTKRNKRIEKGKKRDKKEKKVIFLFVPTFSFAFWFYQKIMIPWLRI